MVEQANKGCNTIPSTRRVYIRMAFAMAAVVALSALIYLTWTQAERAENVETRVLTEARTLAVEMQAVWDYVDDSQNRININSDGTYDFKGVYCSVAGKGIAKRFTRNSEGYSIRYVRNNPRTGTDAPDELEAKALALFERGSADEFYAMSTQDGQPVFRYISRLTMGHNCLECHGEPAGSIDQVGFIREGMKFGDVAGAVSISIPIAAYEAESRESMQQSVAFFCVLIITIVVVLFWMLRRWVSVPLEQANEQLRQESRQKSDFLAIMSHELRTPLSSIISFTDLWERMPQTRTDKERKLVEEIKQNSTVLLNMVNNTIDTARLEAGRFEFTFDEVDLSDVVGAVFASADTIAQARGIHLEKSIDPATPLIWSDWEAVRKIMLNLVGNALKFTPEGGRIWVQVKPDSDRVRFEVGDTGCGISAEDAKHVFGKFLQGHPNEGETAGTPGGSGLGLFVVRSLVEQLGGTIELDSELGCGSVFTVSLPIDSRRTESGESWHEENAKPVCDWDD